MLRIKWALMIIIFFNLSWAIWDIRVNNLGQWQVCISNYGKFGQSINGTAGAWWPRNSGHNYIYGAGIWVGAIAPNGDTLATIGYLPLWTTNTVFPFYPPIPAWRQMDCVSVTVFTTD